MIFIETKVPALKLQCITINSKIKTRFTVLNPSNQKTNCIQFITVNFNRIKDRYIKQMVIVLTKQKVKEFKFMY